MKAGTREDAIVFERVGKRFRTGRAGGQALTALEDISFTLARGEFAVILGPSGCGKSTILNILAGFERPSTGKVRIFGREVGRPSAAHGMVFQEDALFPWLTVRENILFGPRCRKVSPLPDVRALLNLVNLEGFEHFLPRELSGGMKQRVALARMLVNDPELLLMDEPFGSLDAQTREEMQALMISVHRRYRPTVLFVTHDVDEAVFLAERVLILSSQPATIAADIPVHAQSGRDEAWRECEDYFRIVAEVRRALKQNSLFIARNP